MSALNHYWVEMRDWNLGLNHNITQLYMWTIYEDPEDPCNVALMTYPGTNFNHSDLKYD